MAAKALVIGISDYDNLEPLDFCKNDGNAMYNVLSSCGYKISANHNLVGYVTWEKMREAIIGFFTDKRVMPKDTLLFYYSGHGVPDEYGDVYLAPSEIDRDFPYNRGYSFSELTKMIQMTPSSRVVVILDCCYSGSATLSKGHEEDKARLGRVAIDNRSRIVQGEGRCILAASQALGEAHDLKGEQKSLFTFYLHQGLEGKDREVLDKHGNITVGTSSKYVYEKIMSISKRPKQKPLIKIESSGDIVLVDKTYLHRLKKWPRSISAKESEEEHKLHTEMTDKSSTKKVGERLSPDVESVQQFRTSITENELIERYSKRQKDYSHEVADQNEATRSFLFLNFLRDIFKDIDAGQPHLLYPELEKYIRSNKTVLIRGRIDAFLGNLIIEFESDLKRYIENCELQLRKYTAILWNNRGKVNYLCVATDGLQFIIFRPRSALTTDFTQESIKLEIVDKFDIRGDDPVTVYKRLDRYILYRTLIPPNAEDIVRDFGYQSIVLKDSISLLGEAWKNVKNEYSVVYNEWSKYLSVVYGSEVKDQEQLFLRHTYLATLAKLMVFSFYQENTFPTSHDLISRILRGDIFREWNIENFLIEDFFSWIVRSDVYKYGIQVALRILDGLERYDLTKLSEDVLKELYQQLVDPTERHYLGEFYTPDWLAEMMVKEVVKDRHLRILDPACGSGTFLASAIRHKLSLMTNMEDSDKVDLIIHTVNGIDVHPLAVLISKSNYLMAIGDALKRKVGALIIPVYMADSIIFPLPTTSVGRYDFRQHGQQKELYHYRIDSQNELVIPKSLVEAESADVVVDSIKEYAITKIREPKSSDNAFLSYLEKRYGVPKDDFEIIIETVNTLINLIRTGRDSIQPFILKNIYKPSIIGKFDVVIGNPPWLSYRFILSPGRQVALRKLIVETYRLLDSSDRDLVTQMDTATLFFIRNADLYLEENGRIAFVLPRSVFTGDQHRNFRANLFNLKLGFQLIYDLEKNQRQRVSPLFSVEACVVFAQRGIESKYPIPTRLMTGRLSKKNSTFTDVVRLIESSKFKIMDHETLLTRIGNRTSWSYEDKIEIDNTISPYRERFRQGATIYPQVFWYVDPVPSKRFGLDVSEPHVQSSQRSLLNTNKQYKGIILDRKVEKDYLFASLLGSDIFPFSHLEYRIVVLPVEVSGRSFQMVTKEEVQSKGHSNMFQWLAETEEYWKNKKERVIENEKVLPMTIYERLNRNRGITTQRPNPGYAVLYNAGGRGNMVSCVLKIDEAISVSINEISLRLHGFIAEHKCVFYYPCSLEEAYYLTAILNSNIAFTVLGRIKAARDIEKKIWELPIPEFDNENSIHHDLSNTGKTLTGIGKSVLDEEIKKIPSPHLMQTGTVGSLRRRIKKIMKQDLEEIDDLVASLVKSKPVNPGL